MAAKKDATPRFVITAGLFTRAALSIYNEAEGRAKAFASLWPEGYDTHKWGWRGFVERFADVAGYFYADSKMPERRVKLYADLFEHHSFAGADFRFAHVSDCVFRDCDLTWADATDAVFVRCAFPGTDLRNADLTRATFVDCIGLDLSGAITNDAYIKRRKTKMSIFEDFANEQLSPEEFEAQVWEAQRFLAASLVRTAQSWKPDYAQSNFSYFANGLVERGFAPSVAIAAVSDAARRAGHIWPVEVD